MKFALPHTPRTREETRTRIAHIVTEMSCRVSLDTLDAALRAARQGRAAPPPATTVTQLEALSTNARNLARNVDTILWTGLPELHAQAEEAMRIAPTTHRSLSVTAIIHKFAALSEAFAHIHGLPHPHPHPPNREDEICEEPAAG